MTPTIAVRLRRRDDIPQLADVLLAQQPISGYPFRNPLPMPVDQFLHADDAVAAWVADVDGHPVGHVCRLGPRAGFPDAADMNEACAAAQQCTVEQLGWVSALFVGLDVRRLGVGRRLLQVAVDDIRADGLVPCLEVLPKHPAALTLYQTTGWRTVMRLRPEWLRAAAGDEGPDVLVMVFPAADTPA